MTPSQAADIIGCTANMVRKKCQHGTIKARIIKLPSGSYCYEISRSEAERIRDIPQTVGYPRGRKRK